MGNAKIAIVASTRNRKDSMYDLVKSLSEFMPDNAIFMIVDDASDEPYVWPDYRFEERAGISRVKNKCLELAMAEKYVEHIFLIDDDVRFLKKGWELPYINSGEHHLCATFLPPHRLFYNVVISCPKLKQDNDNLITVSMESQRRAFKSHLSGNGYCLYFTRHCIETVGGFDTRFKNKYEHSDLSRRIFNAGLIQHIYQDVINSDKLIYCLDQDNAIQRSFTDREMQDNLKQGYDLFRSKEKDTTFIPFII